MKLLVGLGNPGEKYQKTRHNIGFLVIDALAQRYDAVFDFDKNFNAELAKFGLNELIMLAKPQTFMNASGEAIQKILHFYKIEAKDLLVIHDDIDLEFGRYKLVFDRNPAGHHGVESIISQLGNSAFWRLRMGIGNAELKQARTSGPETKKERVAHFVTSSFTAAEQELLQSVIANATKAVDIFLNNVNQ